MTLNKWFSVWAVAALTSVEEVDAQSEQGRIKPDAKKMCQKADSGTAAADSTFSVVGSNPATGATAVVVAPAASAPAAPAASGALEGTGPVYTGAPADAGAPVYPPKKIAVVGNYPFLTEEQRIEIADADFVIRFNDMKNLRENEKTDLLIVKQNGGWAGLGHFTGLPDLAVHPLFYDHPAKIFRGGKPHPRVSSVRNILALGLGSVAAESAKALRRLPGRRDPRRNIDETAHHDYYEAWVASEDYAKFENELTNGAGFVLSDERNRFDELGHIDWRAELGPKILFTEHWMENAPPEESLLRQKFTDPHLGIIGLLEQLNRRDYGQWDSNIAASGGLAPRVEERDWHPVVADIVSFFRQVQGEKGPKNKSGKEEDTHNDNLGTLLAAH